MFCALASSSVFQDNLSCVIATILYSFAFLSPSISMANMSQMVASSTSLARVPSSISMTNLSCLLATILFSVLSFFSNSLSSPRFNLLRVTWLCFSWPSFYDPFFSYSIFGSPSCSCIILSLSFLCSSISEAPFALSFK